MEKTAESITRGQVREYAERAGSPFFSPATMRAFGSRVQLRAYRVGDRLYFVTSERDPMGYAWDGQRRYSVRTADVAGDRFDTEYAPGTGFGEFGTRDQAMRAMEALVEEVAA